MIKALLSVVTPPTFDDPTQMYQARLLHIVVVTLFAAMAVFAAVFLFINPDGLGRLVFVVILVPPFAAARVLVLRGQIRAGGFLVVSALWAMITLTVFTGGGIRGPGVPAYVVPVALAGFVLGWRVGVIFTVLTMLSCAVFALAEMAGWQPRVIAYDPAGMLVIQILILVVVIVLVSLADRGIKQALADSQMNALRFQETFENAPIGMALVDLNERIFKVNPALSAILGYSAEQLLTKTVPQITHPDDVQREVARKQTAIQGGSASFSMEKRYIHADGHVIWGRLSVSLVHDALGMPSYYIGQLEDITEERWSTERIRKLNRIYRLLSDINQAIVRIRDLPVLFEKGCRTAVEHGGFVQAWIGLVDPVSGAVQVAAQHGAAEIYLDSGEGVPQEPSSQAVRERKRVICNDIAASAYSAAWREWVLRIGARSAAAFPLVAAGEVRGVFNLFSAELDLFDEEELKLLDELAMDLGFAIEVAEKESSRWQAEEQLRHSEERYRQLAEDMPALVCTFLPDSTLTYVNTAYCEYFQQRREDLIGRQFLDFLPNEAERQAARARYLSLTPENPKHIHEHLVTAPDGSERWQEWVNRAFFGPSGEAISFQSVGLDVSERKLAEMALRASEEQYRELVDSLSDLVFMVDVEGRIRFINPAVEAMTGYTPEEVRGRSFVEYVHSDDLEMMARLFQQAMRGLSREEIPGAPDVVEGRLIKRNGEAMWMTMRGSVVRDSQGTIQGFRGVVRDITERKLSESRRLEAERLQIELEKERELGELKTRFVSMVSHEFRTPLAVIFLASSTLLMYPDKLSDERKTEKLKLIQSQIKRLEAILEDTLFITRHELGKLKFTPAQIDLEMFSRELAQDVDQLGQTGRIEVLADGSCGMVPVDTNLLRYILINLLSNALKYSPEDRTVRLDLSCADGRIVLRVEDQGIGIPEDDLRHLFEPFHRGRNVGQISGTGLGLTIVKRSVEAHGGTIQVESQEGQGTTVTVMLPIEGPPPEID